MSTEITTTEQFEMQQRQAKALSVSDLIPDRFRGKMPNCLIAMQIANNLNINVLEVMRNLYVVYGNPSWSSSYLIARINNSKILKGRLKYRFFGTPGTDDYGCQAYGIEADTEEELPGSTVTIKLAKDEGWWGKKGSKWPTMTEQMLMYRAASFWSRIHAPEATLGLYTTDELQDIPEEKFRGKIEVVEEQPLPDLSSDNDDLITDQQLQLLTTMVDDSSAMEMLCNSYNVKDLSQLKQSQLDEVKGKVEEFNQLINQ